MDLSFDAAKSEYNLATRGISLQEAAEFEWISALIAEDLRRPYGEQRFQALGFTGSRLHMLVFTPRARKTHVISLCKANKREVKRYEAQT